MNAVDLSAALIAATVFMATRSKQTREDAEDEKSRVEDASALQILRRYVH
jgi:hypothetical protein